MHDQPLSAKSKREVTERLSKTKPESDYFEVRQQVSRNGQNQSVDSLSLSLLAAERLKAEK